ncbi:MAG: hypothetical protein PHI90_06615 [Clostridia bacterium]|nr:hypothetical protein [Clostridia bacterium]MDD4048482.1 hypothetical protein [Clostridia bacterium]
MGAVIDVPQSKIGRIEVNFCKDMLDAVQFQLEEQIMESQERTNYWDERFQLAKQVETGKLSPEEYTKRVKVLEEKLSERLCATKSAFSQSISTNTDPNQQNKLKELLSAIESDPSPEKAKRNSNAPKGTTRSHLNSGKHTELSRKLKERSH